MAANVGTTGTNALKGKLVQGVFIPAGEEAEPGTYDAEADAAELDAFEAEAEAADKAAEAERKAAYGLE